MQAVPCERNVDTGTSDVGTFADLFTRTFREDKLQERQENHSNSAREV